LVLKGLGTNFIFQMKILSMNQDL